MFLEFIVASETAREPVSEPRPQVQRQARLMTELAPNPYNREIDGGLAYPYPGKGAAGETTN